MSPPNHYVDANIDKVQNANGSIMWETHSAENFKAAIVHIQKTLNEYGKLLSQYGDGRRP